MQTLCSGGFSILIQGLMIFIKVIFKYDADCSKSYIVLKPWHLSKADQKHGHLMGLGCVLLLINFDLVLKEVDGFFDPNYKKMQQQNATAKLNGKTQ